MLCPLVSRTWPAASLHIRTGVAIGATLTRLCTGLIVEASRRTQLARKPCENKSEVEWNGGVTEWKSNARNWSLIKEQCDVMKSGNSTEYMNVQGDWKKKTEKASQEKKTGLSMKAATRRSLQHFHEHLYTRSTNVFRRSFCKRLFSSSRSFLWPWKLSTGLLPAIHTFLFFSLNLS